MNNKRKRKKKICILDVELEVARAMTVLGGSEELIQRNEETQ
jgi:hypothetical protein